MKKIRINKMISESGVLSRRKADEAIAGGRVTVNDAPADLGTKVSEEDVIKIDGVPIKRASKKIVAVFYKPIGYTCTSLAADKDSIYKIFKLPKGCAGDVHLNYVGRLDKDSQGLLLMTNDGDLSNKIQKSVNGHEKEYIVRVDRRIDDRFLNKFTNGVRILDTVTKPCTATKQGPYTFSVILTQGLNRQIRRMCEALGYKVTYLKRIREINIKLGGLRPGESRLLTRQEETELRRIVEG